MMHEVLVSTRYCRWFKLGTGSHVGTSYACSDFFMQKNQSPAPLFLLFRKKARSAYLFGCKRPHDGALSLPPFYEYACGVVASKSFGSSTKKTANTMGLIFYIFFGIIISNVI